MRMLNFPVVLFVTAFIGLWVATKAGVFAVRRIRPIAAEAREDYNVVLTATLTLLGLIVGFTFSMALSRYDQRKNYEEEETNAIGTEYVRADLLPPADREQVQELLRKYIGQRILFYTTRDARQLSDINAYTAQLQGQLWSAVQLPAITKASAVTALAASGMNDVLNSQGYTQAAWLNRIPPAAWILMISIAVCCNFLLGYGVRCRETGLLVILPLVLGITFFLIADIDSPRRGVIRVFPDNLHSLSQSFQARK